MSRSRENIDFLTGVVERERRATCCGHAEAREQRHRAMRARPHRDAVAVDHRWRMSWGCAPFISNDTSAPLFLAVVPIIRNELIPRSRSWA